MNVLGAVRIVGKTLIATGVLILLFVAYELWGTGRHEAQAQHELSDRLDTILDAAATTTTTADGPTTTTPGSTVPSVDLVPGIGDPVGRIEIPKLKLRKTFVQGDSLAQLDRAPGHYPSTPFPGQAGNAAIAGHRTTYGAPFFHLDKLTVGDKIITTTSQGTFTYSVSDIFIVDPYDSWVLATDDKHPNTLTLTACHPRYSLAQRLIVRAVLDGEPVEQLPGQAAIQKKQSSESLAGGIQNEGRVGSVPATVAWGAACIGLWLVALIAGKRWRRRAEKPRVTQVIVPYLAVLPFGAVALYLFFENLAQVLPAGL